VTLFEKQMLARKIVTPKGLRELEAQLAREIDEAASFAESSPMPEGVEAVKGVYCEEDCYWKDRMIG
jgi:TPP-dependent pyruvate/acetoin dehydrogenase alpha subunit